MCQVALVSIITQNAPPHKDQPENAKEDTSLTVTSSSESDAESKPIGSSNLSSRQVDLPGSPDAANNKSPEVIELERVPSKSSQSLEDIVSFSFLK